MYAKLDYQEAKRRIAAAQAIFSESSTTKEKLDSAFALLSGIHPSLDRELARSQKELNRLDMVMRGAVIELSADALPEKTEEEKKRKKALLFFIKSWKKLGSEMARVEKELAASQNSSDGPKTESLWSKILKLVTGPLGIITVVAVGAVLLKTTSVEISIQNDGCGTFYASNSLPIPIPGFSFPTESIPDGASGTAKLPPISVNIDGTASGAVILKALTFTMTLELPADVSQVSMNGVSLLGTKTEVHLSERKEHTLVLSCL